jgi:hypothetical protein
VPPTPIASNSASLSFLPSDVNSRLETTSVLLKPVLDPLRESIIPAASRLSLPLRMATTTSKLLVLQVVPVPTMLIPVVSLLLPKVRSI